MLNYFNAAKDIFYTEWNDPKSYILSKTVGFEGLMDALNKIVPLGEKNGDLSKTYFSRVFLSVRSTISVKGIKLNADNFPSNATGKKFLSNLIVEAVQDTNLEQ